MTLVQLASNLRESWDALFKSAYVEHLETEIMTLRGHNNMLLLQLSTPKVAPAVKREFPKFTPVKTSWEKHVEEEMRKQELEETPDGTHSSGR